jgi:glycosyltransferase involved in cell wall biosynthesis
MTQTSQGRPKRVAMLFSRGFFPDARGHKEARDLVRAGYEVTILAWDRECRLAPREVLDGFTVERLQFRALLGKGFAQFHRWLRFWSWLGLTLLRRKYEVLHANDLDTLPVGWLAAKMTGAKLVFDAREPNYYAYWPAYQYPALFAARLLERFLSLQCDHVIVCNRYQVGKYSRMGVRRITIVANYPPLSMVSRVAPPIPADGEVTLGRVGAIYDDCGIEEIVEAVHLLLVRGKKVRLFLAGRLVDSYRARLTELIRPLADKVELRGAFTHREISDLYGRCHISIPAYRPSPWFREITPVKFFESIAHGVPVIATDIGGIGDMISQAGCGRVLPEPSAEAIADAVEELVGQPDVLREMGERGMAAVREMYNWERLTPRLLKLYREL